MTGHPTAALQVIDDAPESSGNTTLPPHVGRQFLRLNVLVILKLELSYILIKPLKLFSGDQDKICYEDDVSKGKI